MRIITCVTLLLLASTIVLAQADLLDKAKSVYRDFEQKQRDVVDAAFDRKIKEATRNGDLDLTTTLKTEQTKFKSSGELPESASMKPFGQKYSKALEAAQKKLAEAYEKEIKSETRAGNIETAKRLQTELDRLNAATDQRAAAAQPAPKAANAAGNNNKVFLVRSAIWKQDGRFGTAGAQTQDVTSMLLDALEQGRIFEPNQKTLSLLDGRPATKSVFLDATIHGVTIQSRLAENSSIQMRSATANELKMKGIRLGKTPMEALSLIYQTTDRSQQVDKTVPIFSTLINGGIIEVSTQTFGELQLGKSKVAVFLFRVGQQALEIGAAEGTQIGIKY